MKSCEYCIQLLNYYDVHSLAHAYIAAISSHVGTQQIDQLRVIVHHSV